MVKNGTAVGGSLLQFTRGEDDTFICLVQIRDVSLSTNPEEENVLPDVVDISIECNTIGIHLKDDDTVYNNFKEEMLASKTVEGNWDLSFQASVDTSNNESLTMQEENNGFVLTNAVKTPSNFHISIIIPTEWIEKNPAILIYDLQGNRIDLMQGKSSILEDGRMLQEWTAERTDANDFLVKVIDKNSSTEGNIIVAAEIPFSMQ